MVDFVFNILRIFWIFFSSQKMHNVLNGFLVHEFFLMHSFWDMVDFVLNIHSELGGDSRDFRKSDSETLTIDNR